MANRAVLSCVEETCRRVTGNNAPFGGKVVIILGDFRQTCPVIPGGSRTRVVNASVRSSPLWPSFKIYRLITPLRNAEDPEFAHWVDTIGDGAGPDINLDMIDRLSSVNDVIAFVFPDDILHDSTRSVRRSILAPTNVQVDAYNDAIIARIDGLSRTYYAADSLKELAEAGLAESGGALDYAAKRRIPGLPDHSITIKVNGVYRLLRNLSLDRGLVKNIRVLVTDIGHRLITVRLLKEHNGITEIDEEDILIPRITFTYVLPSGHTLLRRQFPLAPAYATTFNSCQGLTLDIVGIDLTRPVFSHGQLYTALSRVRHRSHVRVRLRGGEVTAPNITYQEILL